ncbi:MAG: hypothetical protein RJA81_2094, partial [Planctomycetota bacterium]
NLYDETDYDSEENSNHSAVHISVPDQSKKSK